MTSSCYLHAWVEKYPFEQWYNFAPFFILGFMSLAPQSMQGYWNSRGIFVLAVAGVAIGMSNIWRFPYLLGEHGGIIFLLFYLLFISLLAVPLMMTEMMLGRMGRSSPIISLRSIAEQNGRSRHWQWLGWGMLLAALMLASFYAVTAGMGLAYFIRSVTGAFEHVTSDGVEAIFAYLAGDAEKMLAWHTVFFVLVYMTVSRSVERGLQRVVRGLIVGIVLLLMVLLVYAFIFGEFESGISSLLVPDFEASPGLDYGAIVMTALEQAFFGLGIGAAIIMAYSAYLPSNVSITYSVLIIVLIDVVIAVLAGMVIFPLIHANDLQTLAFTNPLHAMHTQGLVFQTMPLVFSDMPMGMFFSGLFYLLLVLVAWTSILVFLEPGIAYLMERYHLTRGRAAGIVSTLVWALGILTILSLTAWQSFYPLDSITAFESHTVFHLMEFLSSHLLLPLGGLLMMIFAGWFINWRHCEDELAMGQEYCGFALWRSAVRYISPVLVIVILVTLMLKTLGWVSY